MRLREYFWGCDDKKEENSKDETKRFKKKSNFTPKAGKNVWLDTYIEVVKGDVLNGLKERKSLNLIQGEEEALKNILNDDSIVIRPADKGSGIVVIDKDEYFEKLQQDITNSGTYSETKEDKTGEIKRKIKSLVNRMHKEGSISGDMKTYLIPKYPHPSKVKGNPKVHKSNKPYRTIISGIGSATEKIAEIAEKELETYVNNTPSYIRDTTDFLNKLSKVRQPLPKNCILFCFDVVKLYPSIPRDKGLKACEKALNARKNKEIPTKDVLEMIKLILEGNNFKFLNKDFLQNEGVAIGSRLGKNFACTYMRQWDQELNNSTNKPIFYKRFIDDGFGIWTHGEDKLKEFHTFANGINKNIQVEMRYHINQIEFLDTLVKIRNGRLLTDLYTKPTDKHIYVHSKSCHPKNVKKAIPYGLALRLRRICENECDYRKHRQELKTQLRKGGYSGKFIENQLKRADGLNRKDLLCRKDKEEKKTERVPLVLTYTDLLPDIHHIVKNRFNILHNSETLKEIFPEPPLVAYRRDRNLQDIIVHGKLNKITKNMTKEKSNIQRDGCEVCDIERHDESIQTNERKINIKDNYHGCQLNNLVYGLHCGHCNKYVYVGETERTLKERIKEHLADIKYNRETTVAEHFNGVGHIGRENMTVQVLQQIYEKSSTYRKYTESQWIKELNTVKPFGANIKAE